MTPETKSWIETVKNKIETSADVSRLIQIIESQEEEIERLKAIEEQCRGYSRWCNICGKVFDDYVGDEENKKLKEEIERLKANQFIILKPGVKYDENEVINYPVQFTQRQWDLISIALIKAQEIQSLPNSPFKEDWESLYKLSKERGSK